MLIDPVIYAIFNIEDDKSYVGQTYNKLKRFGEHKKTLNAHTHCNAYLQRAWNKCGQAAFIFVMLESVDEIKNLTEREQYWTDKLKPEYNIAPVAGSLKGYKHTNEAIQNMSDAHKGYKASPETRAKMSEQRKGNKFAVGSKRTKEHMDAILASNKGFPKSEEHKAKIAAGNRGKIVSEETKRKQSEAAKKRWATLDDI